MIKSKRTILIRNKVYILLILFSFFSTGCGIIKQVSNSFSDKEIVMLNLTQDEKIADFEELYNNMIESVPSLNDHKVFYNIDFKGKRDYYLDLIEHTENDFDFFCMMSAIHEDIPGMHTDICEPVYAQISNMGCYNAEKTFAKKNIKPLTEYWYECIGKACEEFSAVQRVNFKYINGQYLFDPMDSNEKYQDLKGFELAYINNEPMEDYAVNNLSYYNLRYDAKRKLPYRTYFTLNDRVGKKVNTTLINSETGNTINKEFYLDIKIEVVNQFSFLYEEKNQSIDDTKHENNIYSYFDYKNNIGYVKVKNFMNSQGEELVTTLQSMKEFESIIIDLRDNYGGRVQYGQKYLYSPIYEDDVTIIYNWFVPNSDSNKATKNTIRNRFFYRKDKDDSGFHYTRKYTYKGESQPIKQSIYYLINANTGSAADGYVALVKENNLGTIVGSNTRGEGLSDSFVCSSLKNSGLVYVYFPSLSYNQDGINNSLYGTSPDIYIEQTKESFYQERNLREQQIDINLYTEKIKYDNILIQTIEMIE